MGNDHSKPEPDNNRQRIHSMAAPAVTCAPCLSGHLNKEHLVLAFFAGVLLTLLLMALVLLITKSCRKCHSSPRALDPHSDPPATVSSPEEALTYASMTFKISKESSDSLTMNHSADADPVVYAQIKVTDSRRLSREA
ncbi:transmembrane protein C1orf162 homolog isoform X2 [Hippopotamus amphibius kiboko]|uniref:transmembrane protein C1orf162 homolog isoform X2 n=1 Tax=Hippopotamus amphibius kiboko TaxID=575201 RepID=UPI002595CF3A|nr:transmembrane protein C1orf162 homolog isoform X2 [Hippopotamus amphibius kiboko]